MVPPLPQQAPPLLFQAPPLPQQAPPLPLQAPPLPLQAPPLPLQAPSLPLQAPPLPQQAPPLPLQAPPLPQQVPPLPQQSPQTSQELQNLQQAKLEEHARLKQDLVRILEQQAKLEEHARLKKDLVRRLEEDIIVSTPEHRQKNKSKLDKNQDPLTTIPEYKQLPDSFYYKYLKKSDSRYASNGNIETINDTPENCAIKCSNIEKCTGFDYNINDKRCNLKTSIDINTFESVPGLDYYFKKNSLFDYTKKPNLKYAKFSNDIKTINNDQIFCADECNNISNCDGFEYNNSIKKCTLKQGFDLNNANQSDISDVYLKNIPMNNYDKYTDKLYSTTGDFYIIKEEPNICSTLCNNIDNCAGFSYNKDDKNCTFSKNIDFNDFTDQKETDFYIKKSNLLNYNKFENIAYATGGDIRPAHGSPELCSKICSDISHCQGFDYHNNDKSCWLKKSIDPNKIVNKIPGLDYYIKK